jgi:hypothetical protein
MMSLIVGSVLLVAAVVIYLVLHWGARQPAQPAWMHGELVAIVHVPLLISVLAFGFAFVIKFAIQAVV